MDLEREYINAFIDCYKSHTALWDTTHSSYMSRPMRVKGYAELLNIMKNYKGESSLEDVKKKIYKLRSCYRRELHKYNRSRRNGDEIPYTPALWYFDKFHFLKLEDNPFDPLAENYEKKGCIKKKKIEKQIKKEVNNSVSDEHNVIDGHEDLIDVILPEMSKRVKIQATTNDNTAALPIEKSTSISAPCPTLGYIECDSFQHLGLVWAKKLRTLPNMQRILAERAINEIIFQGELGTLSLELITQLNSSIKQNCSTAIETTLEGNLSYNNF